MSKDIVKEIDDEMALAELMVGDMDRIFKKYAKAASEKFDERQERIRNEKYQGCSTAQELQEYYGWGNISEAVYMSGLEFFEKQEDRQNKMSVIERHRANIKEIRDRWKGTILELKRERDVLQ